MQKCKMHIYAILYTFKWNCQIKSMKAVSTFLRLFLK